MVLPLSFVHSASSPYFDIAQVVAIAIVNVASSALIVTKESFSFELLACLSMRRSGYSHFSVLRLGHLTGSVQATSFVFKIAQKDVFAIVEVLLAAIELVQVASSVDERASFADSFQVASSSASSFLLAASSSYSSCLDPTYP